MKLILCEFSVHNIIFIMTCEIKCVQKNIQNIVLSKHIQGSYAAMLACLKLEPERYWAVVNRKSEQVSVEAGNHRRHLRDRGSVRNNVPIFRKQRPFCNSTRAGVGGGLNASARDPRSAIRHTPDTAHHTPNSQASVIELSPGDRLPRAESNRQQAARGYDKLL